MLKCRFRHSRPTREPEALHFDRMQRARQSCWILSSGKTPCFPFMLWPELTHRVTNSSKGQGQCPVLFSALIAELQKEKAAGREFSSRSVLATEAHCKGPGHKGGLRRVKSPPPACPTLAHRDTSQSVLRVHQSRDLSIKQSLTQCMLETNKCWSAAHGVECAFQTLWRSSLPRKSG